MINFTNRFERLTYILMALSKGESLSTPALVAKHGLSKKVIQTDFNTYILPYVDAVYYDGATKCHVSTNAFLQKMRLSAKQLATILMVKAKASDKYTPDGLLESIDALFADYNDLLEERLYAQAMVEKLEPTEHRTRIEYAIKSKQVITCTYNNKARELCPLSIINLEGFWYLVNYDREYEDIRRYHLKSIVDVEVLDESFTITPEIAEILERFKYAINAYFEPLVEPYAVELYIDAKVAKYFERMPLNSRQRVMQRYDDGSIDLEIYITDDMEIIPTVQRYMPYVRVIEPYGLKEKFCELPSFGV